MKLLIKKATIIAPSSPLNGKIKDIFIANGIITKIANSITDKADKTIEQKGLHVSIGWVDIFVHFCDPGFEYRETLETGAKAAAAGGFTDVFVIPNTDPVIHNKSQIEYIVEKSKNFATNIYPIGSVTKNAEGKELTEMYDMHQSGAVAFSDGNNAIQTSGLLLKALQYLLPLNKVLIQIPDDKNIGATGLINEGIVSTQLGLPGKPAIAEELMITRDIELAKYTGGKIHFTGVSTKKGIELIGKAKKEGLQITCSVTPYHLLFCDEDLTDYDTNLKVNPVLRTKQDVLALQKALADGKIDCIASHHIPQNWDNKICEFEYAKNGMIGLESLFGAMGNLNISIDDFVKMQTENTRLIFGLGLPQIKENETACLTLFLPNETYIFDEKSIQSKSKNSAFIGKSLKGKVIGIINGTKTVFN
jgi:dihydroorotase